MHAGLLIYTHSSRENDTGFERCFPADTATFWFTVLLWGSFYWCFIILELGSSHENDANYDYKISRWLVALVVCVVFVIAQSVQLIYIMRAFRGPAGRMDSELELGFGQVLMFFMIAQLVAEFSRGLWRWFPYPLFS